jgi:hypothetical protein
VLAGGTGDQTIGQAGALAANLVTLMDEVAALWQAQALTAQAAAALRPQDSFTQLSPRPGRA